MHQSARCSTTTTPQHQTTTTARPSTPAASPWRGCRRPACGRSGASSWTSCPSLSMASPRLLRLLLVSLVVGANERGAAVSCRLSDLCAPLGTHRSNAAVDEPLVRLWSCLLRCLRAASSLRAAQIASASVQTQPSSSNHPRT